MCGRAAQTQDTARAAAHAMGAVVCSPPQGSSTRQDALLTTTRATTVAATVKNDSFPTDNVAAADNVVVVAVEIDPSKLQQEKATNVSPPPPPALPSTTNDNFNMSPGMDAMVIWYDTTTTTTTIHSGTLRANRKTWGLIPRGGTRSAPFSCDHMARQHFSLHMFNARSDTLYQKTTFARLANAGKTCIVALDGYFEWKTEGTKGPKQPYFIYPRPSDDTKTTTSKPYLLVAGLWTSVRTGHDEPTHTHTTTSQRRQQPPSVLETFTMITTDACPSLQWLHHRMPVLIWDEQLASQWLKHPSERVLDQLDHASRTTRDGRLQWHAVTKAMSSLQFRDATAIQPVPKLKTVTSFFFTTKKTTKPLTSTQTTRGENPSVVSAAPPPSLPIPTTPHQSPHPSPPSGAAAWKPSRSDPSTTVASLATATKKRKSAATRSTNGSLDSFVTRRKR